MGPELQPPQVNLDAEWAIGGFSQLIRFDAVKWRDVPAAPGVYIIYDKDELIYIGMSGRNGKGTLRNRLRDHATGQIVNMFAQYLFLARVQFLSPTRITHPRDAKQACHLYIREHCSFRFKVLGNGNDARILEDQLKAHLKPTLNAPED